EKAGIQRAKIGKVEILREFSFFEIEAGVAEKVLKTMKGAKIDGRSVTIQYAEKKPLNKKKKSVKKSRRSR
ncbi:MAG: ATP-dependent helicase, partial [Deltaproteobacteria bacterium]